MKDLFVADAHLDLAYNALRGRNILIPADDQPADREGRPSVSLPDLRKGGIGLMCATVFALPRSPWTMMTGKSYATNQEAFEIGQEQLRYYRELEKQGEIRIVTKRLELPSEVATNASSSASSNSQAPTNSRSWLQGNSRAIPTILLMENGDQIRDASDAKLWFDCGVRVVGLAWKRTKYCGGTGAPGPLTKAGVELVKELDRVGMIHDIAHLSEESFWQLLDLTRGPILASHCNCRTYVPMDRQISDVMISAIFDRGGVIGINFYDRFLMQPEEFRKRKCTFDDLIRHVDRLCDIAGDARHVAIGSDMDGGVGRDEIPHEISTSADVPKLAEALSARGYGDEEVRGIMGLNWLRFFGANLPV